MKNKDITALKCLVVDDHQLMRQMVHDILISMGITNIEYAEDGKSAYAKINANLLSLQKQYDLVFLDMSMPEVDGYTVLQKCRQNTNYDKVAIVMVTAETEKSNLIKSIKTGATSYIQKPFTKEQFQERLVGVLNWLQA
jgi:two-component system chemotaxis response regulator CheY